MWLDTQHGWSIDEDWEIDHWEMSDDELAESNQILDRALKALSAQPSLDPDCGDLQDLALADLRLRRLH